MLPEVAGEDIQLENGEYTRIHNAILEMLAKARFTAPQLKVLIVLLRKTYGWQKKEDAVSLSQWQEATGLTRHNVAATLAKLVDLKVIYRTAAGQGFAYGFNKYVEQWDQSLFAKDEGRAQRWRSSSNVGTSSYVGTSSETGTSASSKTGTGTSSKTGTHKRKKEKESEGDTKILTAQQELFGAVCKCVGWDSQTLTRAQRGHVSSTVGVLIKAGYAIDDLRTFWQLWRTDWRWTKNKSLPTLEQLRAEIGRVRQAAEIEVPFAAEVYG